MTTSKDKTSMLVTNPQQSLDDGGTPTPFYPLPDLPPQRPDGPASGAEFDDWYWKLQHFNAQIAAVRAEAERACAIHQAEVAAAIERNTAAIQAANACPTPADPTAPAPAPSPEPSDQAALGQQALQSVTAWLAAVHEASQG